MATGTTEERLEKLERTTRRYRLVLAGLGTVVLACVIWVGLGTARKDIRAREFIVEDKKGDVRIGLGVAETGPRLIMFDEKGQARIGLVVTEAGPVLELVDEKGKLRAQAGVGTAEQDGKLITFTESSLRLFNGDGTLTWSAP